MPHYMIQAAYNTEGWASLTKQPQDRSVAIKEMIKAVKGRLISFYNSFGEYDAVVIVRLPDDKSAAALSMAAAAGGAIKALKTTPLMTASEGVAAMRSAKRITYQPPQ